MAGSRAQPAGLLGGDFSGLMHFHRRPLTRSARAAIPDLTHLRRERRLGLHEEPDATP